MNNQQLSLNAINKVINYCAELNIQLTEEDFFIKESSSTEIKNNKHICVIFDSQIYIYLYYKFTPCSEEIKNKRNDFLNFPQATVFDNQIQFIFDFSYLTKTAETTDMNKVVARINKLLDLSDKSRNNSEEEAIRASLKAQELLAKYNISLTDLSTSDNDTEIYRGKVFVGTGKRWKYLLAVTIAENFRCKVFFVAKRQIAFYGFKADTLIARRVYIYLFNIGHKLATNYVYEYKKTHSTSNGVYNNFCKGFVNGVSIKLAENSKQLALIIPKKVENEYEIYTQAFTGKPVNTDIKGKTSTKAYKQGELEGERAFNSQYICS